MKYTILPGIVRTEVCGETMLVACGSARGQSAVCTHAERNGGVFVETA